MGNVLIAGAKERVGGGDASAELQARTRRLQELYEREVYLVYNLALRVTCAGASARAASEQAFMGQLDASEDELVPATVRAALGHARGRHAPDDAGASEQEELLRALAQLTPSERAVLALSSLADADAGYVAGVLGLDAAQAAGLLERASSKVPDTGWAWADPPPALWESLYKNFHQTVWSRLQAHGAPAVAADEQPTTVIRPAKRPRRFRPRNLKLLVALVTPLLLVAGAYAYQQSRPHAPKPARAAAGAAGSALAPDYGAPLDDQPEISDTAASDDSNVDPLDAAAKRKKPLTPQELDALRLQELRALRHYEKEQTDKRLTQAQRDYAAHKAGELRALARERADAKARERRLARRERAQERRERALARERAEQQGDAGGKETVTVVQPGDESTPNSGSGGGGDTTTRTQGGSGGGSTPGDQNAADQQCLQDADTGQYICQTP